MVFQNRYVSSFDLSDQLRRLERKGVQVPELGFSLYAPRFDGVDETTGDELYFHRGLVRVSAGQVIDSHGNVVNLSALEKEAARQSLKMCIVDNPNQHSGNRDYSLIELEPANTGTEELVRKLFGEYGLDEPDYVHPDPKKLGRIFPKDRFALPKNDFPF